MYVFVIYICMYTFIIYIIKVEIRDINNYEVLNVIYSI